MLAALLYVAPVIAPFVALWLVCDVLERMEKRVTRANELPAQSPVASEAATEGKIQLVLMRGNERCATMGIHTARTRPIGSIPAIRALRARSTRGFRF